MIRINLLDGWFEDLSPEGVQLRADMIEAIKRVGRGNTFTVDWLLKEIQLIEIGRSLEELADNKEIVRLGPDQYALAAKEGEKRVIATLPCDRERQYKTGEVVESAKHGTQSGYEESGCRCAACMQWMRDRSERKRRNRGAKAMGIAWHGSASAYATYGCRCRPCAAAMSAYQKQYKEKLRAKRAEKAIEVTP